MRHAATSPAPSRRRLGRERVLPVLGVLLALALIVHGPIPQWAAYHAFADRRALFGVPNAADVLSNLPFGVIGLWALWTSRGQPIREASLAWAAFALALIGTAAGSATYHWAPTNALLAFDRLPIAWACAALTCAFLAERVDARWAGPGALGAALTIASASVALWWWSEAAGRSDLRAYLYVQFLPMLLVPAGLLLRLPRRSAAAVADAGWWGVLAGYILAKAFELADQAVLEHIGLVSGHTLKHLVAAAAAAWLLHAARRAAKFSCGSPR
ncbi:hypothetical protein [uncultured Piscinibacter sp.]|uniref:hypothetical protein n=1 Tax=uncultured Piscinibacter sp. TaxID=1131835 RepID=UPI0026390ED5|nr:hypothetical protein [uncultured Piscinibacter sp.]